MVSAFAWVGEDESPLILWTLFFYSRDVLAFYATAAADHRCCAALSWAFLVEAVSSSKAKKAAFLFGLSCSS